MRKSNKTKPEGAENNSQLTDGDGKILSIRQLQQKIFCVSDRHLRRIANSDSERMKKIQEDMEKVEVLALQNQSKLIQELKTLIPIK